MERPHRAGGSQASCLPLDPVAIAHGTDTARPNKVRRYTQQHDSETNGAVQRKLVKQAESYHSAGGDEEQSCERMRRNAKRIGNPTVREGAILRIQCTLPNRRVSACRPKYEHTGGG